MLLEDVYLPVIRGSYSKQPLSCLYFAQFSQSNYMTSVMKSHKITYNIYVSLLFSFLKKDLEVGAGAEGEG